MSRAHIAAVPTEIEPGDEDHASGNPSQPEAARTDPVDEEPDDGYEPL